MDNTIQYYNQNAELYAADTVDVDFSEVQDRFITFLQKNSVQHNQASETIHILDFGCGSGRDTAYFISKGFKVDAIDGSEELCKIAEKNTGVSVKCMLFSDLDETDKYDGIWACSSILHLPKDVLRDVLRKMITALKANGIIYTSFKHSEFEGFRNGRYFTDFTSESFHEFIKEFEDIKVAEEWLSGDVRPGRGDERWLNLILQKLH